jgi:hypothetical protein
LLPGTPKGIEYNWDWKIYIVIISWGDNYWNQSNFILLYNIVILEFLCLFKNHVIDRSIIIVKYVLVPIIFFINF